MSRCFPFPPPGYEKKPTTDDTDLLKKEKRKEKKHKKDKKDKEKRDGKEKKDDKSEGKHKEKKEKKDKHRDKKKDKEKAKNGNLDDKKVNVQLESYNGETFHQPNGHKEKDVSLGHKKSSVQFRNGEHKEESRKENCSSLDDKKLPVRNRIKAEDIDNSKFVQELRRIRDDEKGTSSRLQFPIESRTKLDAQVSTNEATFGRVAIAQNVIDGAKEKESDDKRGDKRKNRDRDKQRQGKDKDTEKDRTKEKTELKRVERDKNINMKNSDTVASLNNLSTHPPNINIQCAGSEFKKIKDMERNGFSHENEPRPNKMARPASNILTENGRKLDFLQNLGLILSDKQGLSLDTSFKVDNKEQRVNGLTASQPLVPKKPPIATNHTTCKRPPMNPQPVSINNISTQLWPVPNSNPSPSVPNDIANQPLPGLPVSKKRPSSEPSARPTHPDAKYLNRILMVPKLEPWSGLDDQEWLFKDEPHFKKTAGDASLHENGLQVWSEAKHLESVDICAFPYVIPY